MTIYLAPCPNYIPPEFRAYHVVLGGIRPYIDIGCEVAVMRQLRGRIHPPRHVEIAALAQAHQELADSPFPSWERFMEVMRQYRTALWAQIKPENVRLEARIAEEFWIAQLAGYDRLATRQSLKRLVEAIDAGAPPVKAREAAQASFGPYDFRQRLLAD